VRRGQILLLRVGVTDSRGRVVPTANVEVAMKVRSILSRRVKETVSYPHGRVTALIYMAGGHADQYRPFFHFSTSL
jgi:hypothetical protein